jgi:protein ImuA
MSCLLDSSRLALPEHLAQAVWRGDALGGAEHVVIPTGHGVLDAELPGGGWPCQAMTEILVTQNAQAEWRLLSPALADVTRRGGCVLLIAPPHPPCLPGLIREGLADDGLISIDARTPAERLWATEQALKARCVSAVLSWLPRVRSEDIRRLHACAAGHPGPFFVFRPMHVRTDSSAAPLRLLLSLGDCPHPLQVEVIKRRGPLLERPLTLSHWPRGLAPLLPVQPVSRPAQAEPPDRSPLSVSALFSALASCPPPSSAARPPYPVTNLSPSHHHAALDGLSAGATDAA